MPCPIRANSFPEFRKALSLHMVETSDTLRALQVKALGATSVPTASYSASRGGGGGGGAKEEAGSAMQLPGGGEVVWHTAVEQVGGRGRAGVGVGVAEVVGWFGGGSGGGHDLLSATARCLRRT